ncbi:MAG TPA: protein-disulfide reductase DsbD domain-containing protein [Vitreimonas sp.]|uniref:protein-disulfide reductase DsbD family protein n=1 Tax=Vitreimonas sp. TaxID=3069702 RepID=UPI002D51F430|nr:protein-disulfide reductase DsbD domain-containing protein [Vitreimonas sp.]HYD86921.1 protein-disulfide reductase DsbD domain-containing protein [Vitreimonas sp.]
MRIALFLVALLFAAPAFAQSGARRVETSLHASRAAVAPGETFTVVLRQQIAEHWHTYWRNPGAAGEAADITWSLPAGFTAGPIQWPAPEPILAAGLVNYGYSGEVLLPVEMRVAEDVRPGDRAQLSADVYLVVCSEDTCVPEESAIALSLPVAAQGRDDPEWGPRIAETLSRIPSRDEGVTTRITAGAPLVLSVAMVGAREPYFFAFDRDLIDYAENQSASLGAEGFSITLPPGAAAAEGPLQGLLTYTDASGARRAVEISAAPGPVLPGTGAQAPQASGAPLDATAIIAAVALAFLGGLILNIMPCVLPVLSMKALAFAGGAHTGEARRHGVFYFAGVIATFLALAGVLIGLRQAGEAVGWGFQLQAPWVTAVLALLFFAIGLNLVGVFSINGPANAGASLASRGGDAGAFFTGALAVIAATPCTAPFMAGAIGVAVTQTAATTLLIFAALALGFALPLTALHFAPSLQRLVPKPGAWMERVKNLLAFPMFATAVWLAWVMAAQTGPLGVLALLSFATALAFVFFVARWGRVWLIAGAALIALTGAVMWRPMLGIESTATLVSEPWSPARVAGLRGEGRAMFVNFTAAWCVTCKVNEAAAFTPRVAQAFANSDVAYLEADWTNRDDTIAAALAEHGRAGVPLYLYYPPQGEPRILAQLLSEDIILETLEGEVQ